jgi:hypothetical protein
VKRAGYRQVLRGSQVLLDRIGVADVDERARERLAQPADVLPLPAHRSLSRGEQPAEDPQEARLAAAIFTRDA